MSAARRAGALALLLASSATAATEWLPDFETASKLARESKRDLFVFVNGSDWCAAARAYEQAAVRTPALEQALGPGCVCVEIDRPDRPTPEQKAAAQKNRGFEVPIHSYPGVALLDAEGRCYMKLEAPSGGAEALAAAVRQARALKERRDAALARAAQASGAERARLLGAALEALGDYALKNGRHSHRALLDELKRLDPQDVAGAQRRLTFNPDAFAEGKLWPLVGEKKYGEALALVDAELKDPRNNVRLRQHLLGLRFYVFQAQENLDEAVRVLKQLVQADASSDLAAQARGYIAYLTQPVTLSGPQWKPEHLRPYYAEWRLDVSAQVREKGVYEVELRRTDGEGISVRDVALLCGSRELAKAAPDKGMKAELTLASLPAGQNVWLRVAAKGQGWFSSRGDILIRRR